MQHRDSVTLWITRTERFQIESRLACHALSGVSTHVVCVNNQGNFCDSVSASAFLYCIYHADRKMGTISD